jgi:hypothetical protein
LTGPSGRHYRGFVLVFLVRLVRVLGILLVVRLVLRAFAAQRVGSGPARPDGSGRDLVRDRVCNTFVPRDRALVARVGGREEFFCSPACRDRGRPELPSVSPAP